MQQSLRQYERGLRIALQIFMIGLILYPDYLPMIDLPQHAAQVSTFNDLLHGTSVWSDMLFIHWDIPYLTTYLLWLLLYQVFTIGTATKIVVALAFIFYMYAVRQLRRSFCASRIVDWVALTIFFGLTYQWGFISFLMAAPFGIMFFLACRSWLETHQGLLKIFVWGMAMYFCHILIFCFFNFLAYLYFLFFIKEQTWKQRLIFTLPFLCFALILIRVVFFRVDENYISILPKEIIQPPLLEKTFNLLYMPWNMNHESNKQPFIYYLGNLGLYVLPLIMGFRFPCRLNNSPPPAFPLLLGTLLVWYFMPRYMLQVNFLYERFALFIPIFYYLTLEKRTLSKSWQKKLSHLAGILFAFCLALGIYKNAYNIFAFQHSPTRQAFEIIKEQIPPKKRVLMLFDFPAMTDGRLTSAIEYAVYPQWYQAEKHGWVDPSYAVHLAMIVRFKKEAIDSNYPQHYGINKKYLLKMDCSIYDYLIIRALKTSPIQLPRKEFITQTLSKNKTCQDLILQTETEHWLLFSNEKP